MIDPSELDIGDVFYYRGTPYKVSLAKPKAQELICRNRSRDVPVTISFTELRVWWRDQVEKPHEFRSALKQPMGLV